MAQFILEIRVSQTLAHPQRPRGSQSGREKMRNKSFRTISKNSSGCRLLIGHKKCFVLLCPIGKQFLLSSFCEFVHNGLHCLATLAGIFGNGPVRVSTQGLFCPYLKTFVAHFLATQVTAPGSPRMTLALFGDVWGEANKMSGMEGRKRIGVNCVTGY